MTLEPKDRDSIDLESDTRSDDGAVRSRSSSSGKQKKRARPLKVAQRLDIEEVPLQQPAARPSVSAGGATSDPDTPRPIPVSVVPAAGGSVEGSLEEIRQQVAEQSPVAQAGELPAGKTPVDAAATTQSAAPATEGQDDPETERQEFHWTSAYSSWSCSMFFHMVALILLGLWVLPDLASSGSDVLITYHDPFVEDQEELEELEEEKETPEFEPVLLKEVDSEEEDEIHNAEDLNVATELLDELQGGEEVALLDESEEVGDILGGFDWSAEIPVPTAKDKVGAGADQVAKGGNQGSGEGDAGRGRGMGGRASRRKKLAEADPFVSEIEPVVEKGLVWLARHQLADGGWTYEHRVGGNCKGQCGDPGALARARYAATGMALLPFLGAGHSHLEGPYKKTVLGGLNYLIKTMGNDGGLWGKEGTMYGHGIATLALCEAYAMSIDTPANSDAGDVDAQMRVAKKIARAARKAAKYINGSQGPDGGWRYNPREIGDTSVLGWQIMALRAAKEAGLTFDANTRRGAIMFLNRVQTNPVGDQSYGFVGTDYAYQPGGHTTKATSAIGMLCRIYMGLPTAHPAVESYVTRARAEGPQGGYLYYNYYANQIMFQYGGDAWDQWYRQMGGSLKLAQAKGGHLDGSWYFPNGDRGADKGGRLYCTAMALLCLEENFRHLRIANAGGAGVGADGNIEKIELIDEDAEKKDAEKKDAEKKDEKKEGENQKAAGQAGQQQKQAGAQPAAK